VLNAAISQVQMHTDKNKYFYRVQVEQARSRDTHLVRKQKDDHAMIDSSMSVSERGIRLGSMPF
jgi:hypothetical protein